MHAATTYRIFNINFTVSDVYKLKIIVSRQSRIFIYNYICMRMIRLYFLCTLPIVIKLLLFIQLKTIIYVIGCGTYVLAHLLCQEYYCNHQLQPVVTQLLLILLVSRYLHDLYVCVCVCVYSYPTEASILQKHLQCNISDIRQVLGNN